MVYQSQNPSSRSGLARREIAVIIVFVSIPLLLLFPYLQQERVAARRRLCERRQIQTAFAFQRYDNQFGQFPGYRNLQAVREDGTSQRTSWAFPVLPYLTRLQPNLGVRGTANGTDKQEPLSPYLDVIEQYGPDGLEATRGHVPSATVIELICPADSLPGKSQLAPTRMSFVVNAGMPDVKATDEIPADWPANGVFTDQFASGAIADPMSIAFLKDHDGEEFTLLLSENVDAGNWTDVSESLVGFVWVAKLVDGQPDPDSKLLRINHDAGRGDESIRFARPSSFHPSGVNSVFCSARSEFVNEDIDYLLFAQMMASDNTSVMLPGTETLVEPPYRVPVPISNSNDR